MTPQLQQAIRLLALSNLEIEGFIAEEIEKNPLLESSAPEEDGADPGARGDARAARRTRQRRRAASWAATARARRRSTSISAAETFHHDSVADSMGEGGGAGMDGSLGLNGASGGGMGEDGPDLDGFADTGLSLADHLLAQAGTALSTARTPSSPRI